MAAKNSGPPKPIERSPYQMPGESDVDWAMRYGYQRVGKEDDPVYIELDRLLKDKELAAVAKRQKRPIERYQVARRYLDPTTIQWSSLIGKAKLSTEEILLVIYALTDTKAGNKPLPSQFDLVSYIYVGMDHKALEPDIRGIVEWMTAQGFSMNEPPVPVKKIKLTTSIADRDVCLQREANKIARSWVKKGIRRFTKDEIAEELRKTAKWKHRPLSIGLILKAIRKQW